jgi:peptidoglycan/LPS O-acetylase OafA/YrhL
MNAPSSMPPHPTSPSGRESASFVLVDGLRGFASLMVLLAHVLDISVKDRFGQDPQAFPIAWRWVSAGLGHGELWVWAFFVISGYCIHQSVSRDIRKHRFSFGRFWLARLTRLYPLYLLGLAIAFIGSCWLPGYREELMAPLLHSVVYSLTLTQGLLNYFPGFLASWSLTFEMAYYLLWPVALWLVGWSWRRALWLSVAFSVAHTLVCYTHWRSTGSMDQSVAHQLWQITALYPLWLAGAALVEVESRVAERVSRRGWLASWLGLGIAFVVLTVLRDSSARGIYSVLLAYAAVPCFAILIAGAGHARLLNLGRVRRACQWLGVISFPCYILHQPILHCIDPLVRKWGPAWLLESALAMTAALLLPLMVIVLFVGPPLERLTLAWRRNLLAGSGRQVPFGAQVR